MSGYLVASALIVAGVLGLLMLVGPRRERTTSRVPRHAMRLLEQRLADERRLHPERQS